MNLKISLKPKWFEITKVGIKTEDYREVTPYWAARLLNRPNGLGNGISFWKGFLGHHKQDGDRMYYSYEFKNQKTIDYVMKNYGFKHFETNVMTLGYSNSTDETRIIKFEHKGIEIRTGNTEWGAEPDKLYFVIKHGKRL